MEMLLASTNQIERTVKQVLPVLAAVVAFGWMDGWMERVVVGMRREARSAGSSVFIAASPSHGAVERTAQPVSRLMSEPSKISTRAFRIAVQPTTNNFFNNKAEIS
jgi:hypothetical protein